MRKSEIFDSFVKIAQEKGLVRQEGSAEHTEKDFSETNPRFDSLTIEQISKLYNTKPELPKDMEYKRNIIEDAHPDSVVVAPSYDKLNGLVENENEGQNIRIRIVMKTPDGHLVNRKYAKKNLLLSLVRVGNELDSRDSEELRKLADVCLEQLAQKKSIEKVGAVPVVAIVVVAAIILGGVYLQQHTGFRDSGFNVNYQNLMGELDDFLKSDITLGVGHKYRPEFLQTLNDFKAKITQFHDSYNKMLPIIDKMRAPRDGRELLELSKQPETQSDMAELKKFREEAVNVYPAVMKMMVNLEDPSYQGQQVMDKGFLTSIYEGIPGISGGKALIANDFDDVARALKPLQDNIVRIGRAIANSRTIEADAGRDLAQYTQEIEAKMAPEAPKAPATPTPETPGGTPPGKAPGPMDKLEEEAKGLFGGLFGK